MFVREPRHAFDAILAAEIESSHETNLENAGPVVQKEVTQGFQPVGRVGVSPAELNPAGKMPASHTDRMSMLRIRGRQ